MNFTSSPGSAKYDGEAAQAQTTARWIENSGPQYVDMDVVFLAVDTKSDVATVSIYGDELTYPARAFSYASWYLCCAAAPGETLVLKIRCDESFYQRVVVPGQRKLLEGAA